MCRVQGGSACAECRGGEPLLRCPEVENLGPGKVDVCVNLYWVYYLTQNFAGSAASLPPLLPENLEEMEELHLKLTRHNGRSGKHGTYNPRHNDRRFDVENSEHIDAERAKQNVYWDRYRGYTTGESREDAAELDFSFEEIELAYYTEHYGDHIDAQNARNEKTRHTERNRTVADLLKNNKTCPEESIYQIGTMDESVPPEVLAQVAAEFFEEFERRFGYHIHIIDWRFIWMRVRPTSMSAMYLTVKIATGSFSHNRKKHWRNWG